MLSVASSPRKAGDVPVPLGDLELLGLLPLLQKPPYCIALLQLLMPFDIFWSDYSPNSPRTAGALLHLGCTSHCLTHAGGCTGAESSAAAPRCCHLLPLCSLGLMLVTHPNCDLAAREGESWAASRLGLQRNWRDQRIHHLLVSRPLPSSAMEVAEPYPGSPNWVLDLLGTR